MYSYIDPQRFNSIVATEVQRAKPRIKHVTDNLLQYDLAGWCENPVARYLESWSSPTNFSKSIYTDGDEKKTIELLVRCRKCQPCLNWRGYKWALRAKREVSNAYLAKKESFFVTLTFRPDVRQDILRDSEAPDYLNINRPVPEQHYGAVSDEASKYVTRWLKRLRKAGYKLRYIAVCEPHADGFPHFHLLIHDYSSTSQQLIDPVPRFCPSRQRPCLFMAGDWREKYGFDDIEPLRDPLASAFYVAKYLTKDFQRRVRASVKYGLEEDTLKRAFRVISNK